MDSLQRRKVRKQGHETADELLDKAVQETEAKRQGDQGHGRLGGDAGPTTQSLDGASAARGETEDSRSRGPESPCGGSMGGEATPDQTPMSQPPQSSPFSPHPFWSEKAKAEAELAQARPSSLDDAAKKLASSTPRRPPELDAKIRIGSEVRVDEEVREPDYRDALAPPHVNRNPLRPSRIDVPRFFRGTWWQGNDRGLYLSPPSVDSRGPIGLMKEQLALPNVRDGREILSGSERSELPVQASPGSAESRLGLGTPEDHLFEIAKLKSLVEHLSDRLEKCEEARSFGSASSGRVRSSDPEGAAPTMDDVIRPPRVPPLPVHHVLDPDLRQFSFEDHAVLPGFGFRSPVDALPFNVGHGTPSFCPPSTATSPRSVVPDLSRPPRSFQVPDLPVGTMIGSVPCTQPAPNMPQVYPMSPRAKQTPVQGRTVVQGVEHVWSLVNGQLMLEPVRGPRDLSPVQLLLPVPRLACSPVSAETTAVIPPPPAQLQPPVYGMPLHQLSLLGSEEVVSGPPLPCSASPIPPSSADVGGLPAPPGTEETLSREIELFGFFLSY